MIKFNKFGNLPDNLTLSWSEFVLEFGFNDSRIAKIKRLLIFLKILKSHDCEEVYIVGSFISNKEFPNDIDLLANATKIDISKLTKEFPNFLSQKGIEQIKKEHNIHLLFLDTDSLDFLNWFRKDRDDNPKGLVKIYLNDIDGYD